jgi:hypothetical protein
VIHSRSLGRRGFRAFSYPAHDLVEVRQMSLASFTPEDLVGSQVDVV